MITRQRLEVPRPVLDFLDTFTTKEIHRLKTKKRKERGKRETKLKARHSQTDSWHGPKSNLRSDCHKLNLYRYFEICF